MHDSSRDQRVQRRAAGLHRAQRVGELGGPDVLEQVAGDTGADRGQHRVLASEGGEHDDLHTGVAHPQRCNGLHPAHPGQHQVQQHDVRHHRGDLREDLLAAAGLADHRHVRLQVQEPS
ncbi:MAG TPA: hypothetical protein VE709_15425 [Pseudonocardiaceae bacterium]|nr:hypothetical protein [Pseudonocardiaceae bacterium]